MHIGPIINRVVESASDQTAMRLIVENNIDKNRPTEDTVSISEKSRTKLAELTDQAREVDNNSAELSLKELTVKNRIDSGYYDTPEFNQKLAEILTDKFLDESI